MSDQHPETAAPVEPYFDRTLQPFGDGPADPLIYVASPRAVHQRSVNFAAKRLVDMRYVSRLDRAAQILRSAVSEKRLLHRGIDQLPEQLHRRLSLGDHPAEVQLRRDGRGGRSVALQHA